MLKRPDATSLLAHTTLPGSELSPDGFKNGSMMAFTPFGFYSLNLPPDEDSQGAVYIRDVARKLPPVGQAKELFDHFVLISATNWGVMHIPSSRQMLERTYDSVSLGEEVEVADLVLLFSIFAGAAFARPPSLLEKLDSTAQEAKAAFKAYLRLATSVADNPHRPLAPSTAALVALSCIAHISIGARGLSEHAVILRMKCYTMAKSMKVHALDTAQSRDERRGKGSNQIELEVQRRVWWNMVGWDWLSAFSGGPFDGAYIVQPRFMNVDMPKNADDHLITDDEAAHDLPSSVPTSMSAFIYRIKLADVCREVVDAMPWACAQPEAVDYDLILAMDKKFQSYLDDLPEFLRLDPASIDQCRQLCNDRPMIALHRLALNFSAHSRLCRLHRHYFLDVSTNPAYLDSRSSCIRSAQTVLKLRRDMDDVAEKLGIRIAQSWIVMQHVFIAGLILAMEVSFNPSSWDAEIRKAKVMATCDILERSREESDAVMEGVQRNLQTLLSTLHKQRPPSEEPRAVPVETNINSQPTISAHHPTVAATEGFSSEISYETHIERFGDYVSPMDTDNGNWDQLWSDFLAVAPELDGPQWNLLLGDLEPTGNMSVTGVEH